jgi:hypothetical protein
MPETLTPPPPPDPPGEVAILRRRRLLTLDLARETTRDVIALNRRHAHLLKGTPHDPQ